MKRWSTSSLTLLDCSPLEAQVAVAEKPLSWPYSEGFAPWGVMTSYISERVLQRATLHQPPPTGPGAGCWLVSAFDPSNGDTALPRTPSLAALGTMSFHFSFEREREKILRMLEGIDPCSQPRSTKERILLILQLTEKALVRDREADTAAAKDMAEENLMGELQFAFLTGYLLQSNSCLKYWYDTVCHVYLYDASLFNVRPRLCRLIVEVVLAQLRFMRLEAERHLPVNRDGSQTSESAEKCPQERGLEMALSRYIYRLGDIIAEQGWDASAEMRAAGAAILEAHAAASNYTAASVATRENTGTSRLTDGGVNAGMDVDMGREAAASSPPTLARTSMETVRGDMETLSLDTDGGVNADIDVDVGREAAASSPPSLETVRVDMETLSLDTDDDIIIVDVDDNGNVV